MNSSGSERQASASIQASIRSRGRSLGRPPSRRTASTLAAGAVATITTRQATPRRDAARAQAMAALPALTVSRPRRLASRRARAAARKPRILKLPPYCRLSAFSQVVSEPASGRRGVLITSGPTRATALRTASASIAATTGLG